MDGLAKLKDDDPNAMLTPQEYFDAMKDKKNTVTSDDDCEFDSEQVTVKIKDKFFEIFRMYGQGSWTSIGLLDKEPDYAFVKIFLEESETK